MEKTIANTLQTRKAIREAAHLCNVRLFHGSWTEKRGAAAGMRYVTFWVGIGYDEALCKKLADTANKMLEELGYEGNVRCVNDYVRATARMV